MEPIVVQKYGGSSVADPQKIRRVAERVVATRKTGKRVCVVVSAMGKTTDELLGLAREISQAPPRRELDMLLSAGERVSMALLSMAIAELGHEAISFTGSQSGIITNDRHSGARIIEVRPYRIQDELERGKIVIVAGFQGVSYKKEVTTLGRGGSDTTAVALAAALGAELCEICSDVEGIFTADPRVVSGARLLDAIRCDEMQELALYGAKVMNAQAVEFAQRANITIVARATNSSSPGTAISSGAPRRGGAAGVAGHKRLVEVTASTPEAAKVVWAKLNEFRVDTLSVRSGTAGEGGNAVTALFSLDDVPDWPRISAAFSEVPAIRTTFPIGAATVVGEGIGSCANAERLQTIANAAGVSLRSIEVTQLRMTALVAPEQVDALVCALHTEWINRTSESPVE